MKEVRERMNIEKAEKIEKIMKGVRSKIDKLEPRRLDHLKEKGTETLLAATPNNMCGTNLSAVDFRDELRDRYRLDILNTLSY